MNRKNTRKKPLSDKAGRRTGRSKFTAAPLAKLVQIFHEGDKYSASVNHGEHFFVGKRATYQGLVGITNDGQGSGVRYDPIDYKKEGHWAQFIYPTSVCESVTYMTNVNTYDSARFTFGFFQFAAHVPDGDFVRFFRAMLGTPPGQSYFPDLSIQDGHIFRETETGKKQLEDHLSTTALMDYLNPSSSAVEDIEVINAAKLIDGTNQEGVIQNLQVDEAINTAKRIMKIAGLRYALDQMIDTVCLVIMDIRHQGRSGSQAIIHALQTGRTDQEKLNNLLEIGAGQYPDRISTLRSELDKLVVAKVLGTKRYQLAANDFA